jgi:fluoroquinolone transport system permease protein
LGYFGVWESWLLYLIPTQPAMLLIEAAFRPLAMWQLLYAFLYGALAGVVSSWVALRSFDEFVVRRERRGAA